MSTAEDPVRPRRTETRELVRLMLAGGTGLTEIARSLGVSKSTVCYHARGLGLPADEKFNRRYDWVEVQRYYDEGHSITDCMGHFGFARNTFWDAVKRGDVKTRPQAMPIGELLVAGRTRNRGHVKLRLIGAGLKEDRCEDCGIDEWRGKPLSLALHHVNGDGRDNRLENLLLLCPNCHSQTDNFAGRNVARARPADLPEGAIPCSELRFVRLPVRGVAA